MNLGYNFSEQSSEVHILNQMNFRQFIGSVSLALIFVMHTPISAANNSSPGTVRVLTGQSLDFA